MASEHKRFTLDETLNFVLADEDSDDEDLDLGENVDVDKICS